METTADRAIAIVGLGAILPDAPNAPAFWENVKSGRYSISEVPPERWDAALYYDADPKAADRTYSKIGAWVREAPWDPAAWKLPIPPRVAAAMDEAQKWAIACCREALADYGYPARPLVRERTAVILGNAMAGEKHYLTGLRIAFPEYARALEGAQSFAALPGELRARMLGEMHERVAAATPEITEDTMPGELGNIIAGRVANLFDLHGPNFVTDAACASAIAALSAAAQGLAAGDFDAVLTGGIDRNMGASTYVKFCKIGALSATGTRPYAAGADGFVMGEGAAVFLVKRLADAERDGDRVYAVLRGVGGASDGRGKGITAPNPVGQRLAVERAWRVAGVATATVSLIEGHGTSTRVGDVAEVQSLNEVFGAAGLARGSVALGSVKSNIGHLKSAAGAAGLLKAALALHDKVLPPSLHFERPNPDIDFESSPLRVNTELRAWPLPACGVRRAGVSAFGFGGTNFHAVLEEYVPGRLRDEGRTTVAVPASLPAPASASASAKAPLRGALVVGGESVATLVAELEAVLAAARQGRAPAPGAPTARALRAPLRVAIDYGDAAELADRCAKALQALAADRPATWRMLAAQGIFRGAGAPPRVAFLYTGQGSQYVNMLGELRAVEPLVGAAFDDADRVMTPLIGKPLSELIFVEPGDERAVAKAEEDLRQTEITQPAVLTVDRALGDLLAAYGVVPDMAMGHSLGEYGALVAAGALPFADALEAVSARGREMSRISVSDHGAMAAVFAPPAEVERILAGVEGYAVIANVNSHGQCVVGGATDAMARAIAAFEAAGHTAVRLPVSHAFHTAIVAPASEPLRRTLERLHLTPPRLPVVANVSGTFYPKGAGAVAEMLDILARQVAEPVQFVRGLETLYEAGARVFVEVGPKKALHGFVEDVLGERGDVVALYTNHPKSGDLVSFNQALCGLYAAGLGRAGAEAAAPAPLPDHSVAPVAAAIPAPRDVSVAPPADRYVELGHMLVDFLERAGRVYRGDAGDSGGLAEPVVISGAGLGLPGTPRVFDDANVSRILHGEQLIDVIPTRLRHAILDKHVTRLVKNDEGGPTFETIDKASDVIKLAGRAGALDLAAEFGIDAQLVPAYDVATRLAIGAGLEALRDAGIPLATHYRTTSRGTQLPEHWALPEALRDDTGVIFASVFPGLDAFAAENAAYYADRSRRERLAELGELRDRLTAAGDGAGLAAAEIGRHAAELEAAIAAAPYRFDRRFLFRVLSMGHSQFAELIGARGPNTQVNSACASTTQAVALAEDWIRAGRCRRVIVVAGDDVTSDHMLEWVGAGFLATGAAATDGAVEDAALPFDRRRHGMLIGMGAAAFVVESAAAARERGVQPICEVLSTVTANSAFHGTRLDVEHICQVMERLLRQAEERSAIDRQAIAPETVFVSHETYTPARGGSAAAEIHALRRAFGAAADRIVIANTKGFTGHAMGVGIEDVVAVKALETGLVPPVANFKEVDPELGELNLSKGGLYPVRYALRLGAGFGSQISMMLLRWVPTPDGARRAPDALGWEYRLVDRAAWQGWLSRVTGEAEPRLEVVQRTLRVVDRGKPAQARPAAGTPAPAPAPAATPRTAPAPALAAPTPASGDGVEASVLALVAEKTGYPTDMLDLDLDLEADLGVDTVKQAELFAAVRAAYAIARDDKLRLRDFPTLRHVIQFVRDRRPELAPAISAPPAAAPAAPAPVSGDGVEAKILALVAEKTGYPTDMLDLDLDLEADLGVDTVKQAELFAAVRAAYAIARDDKLRLRDFPTLRHVIQFVRDRRPELAPAISAPPAAAPAAPAPVSGDGVEAKILALVAEKTGYPTDMLDLDLDLEADLGVDTVKQAELFAAVRAAYAIARDDKLRLRDFPTLRHVIQFVRDRRPEIAAAIPAPAAPAPAEPAAGFAAADAVPRRTVEPRLRPPLGLCKPTAVAIAPGSRVLVMCDRGGVGEALIRRLEKLGAEVLSIDGAPDADDLLRRLAEWTERGPVRGVYWLPALDDEGDLGAMDLAGWREALRVRVKLLFHAMRALYEHFDAPGAFLVSATRLGGQHGYGAAGATAPLGGAVAGFTKTYKRERPAALVKVVDFASERAPDEIAELLVEETLSDPGAVEIGYAAGQRWTVGLCEEPAADGQRGLALGRDTVFVVTGAAGSVTSAITADLAAASGGTFYLLDVVPEPDPSDPDLGRFAADREGLKRDLFERIKARGERATPAMVEKELAVLERAQAALGAIQAVQKAGGVVRYHRVDLRDAGSVATAIADVREQSGRVDVLLHAAGLEISHFLPDKSAEEFDRVFDVKSDGWFNLLHAIGEMPLAATVAFSSIAARFGNGGQADYSSANDLLCKCAASFRATRPATRGIAVDWTAWGGIGMATRGSIPKMMELAGIDMLAPEAGIPVVRRELSAGGRRGEILIGQRLGALLDECDETGGLDVAAAAAQPHGPMIGRVLGMGIHGGLAVETVLDPRAQAFLHDHQIDATPVLPGVMGIEAFADLAALVAPGWHVVGLEDVEFLAPFKFYRGEPRALTLSGVLGAADGGVLADCRLTGSRTLPGQAAPAVTTHFTARVRLAARPPEDVRGDPPPAPGEASVGAKDVYRVYFHGPAYQVLRRVWRSNGAVVGELAAELPPDRSPADLPTRIDPRLIELCFQTAGIWELGTTGRMALPRHVAEISCLCRPRDLDGPLFAVVRAEGGSGGFDAEVVDARGRVCLRMRGYQTVALPESIDEKRLEPLRRAMRG